MAKKNKLRPLGHTLLFLEKVIDEMTEVHGLQWGDVLNLVKGHLEVHCPHAREQYAEDNSHPVFYYGPDLKQRK